MGGSEDSEGPSGAYGFRLSGLPAARRLLLDVPETWPRLTIERHLETEAAPRAEWVTDERAQLRLRTGGWVELTRGGHVAFHLPGRADDAEIVHPYLASSAAVAARWHGHESLHAGAVVLDGGAWAVLGDKESGKSTTLAHLALEGHPVLTDDVLVVAGTTAFAGPRCIDLRAPAAQRLGAGEPLGTVGARERFRMALGPVPLSLPLQGFVSLAWGAGPAVEAVAGAARLLALLPHRALLIETSAPADLLELAALPHLVLRRPRDWSSLGAAAERLLAAVAS